jgi:ammonia channel protein AmtB
MGLRPDAETEIAGLDTTEHGEEGYHGDAFGGSLLSPKPASHGASAHTIPATAKAMAS